MNMERIVSGRNVVDTQHRVADCPEEADAQTKLPDHPRPSRVDSLAASIMAKAKQLEAVQSKLENLAKAPRLERLTSFRLQRPQRAGESLELKQTSDNEELQPLMSVAASGKVAADSTTAIMSDEGHKLYQVDESHSKSITNKRTTEKLTWKGETYEHGDLAQDQARNSRQRKTDRMNSFSGPLAYINDPKSSGFSVIQERRTMSSINAGQLVARQRTSMSTIARRTSSIRELRSGDSFYSKIGLGASKRPKQVRFHITQGSSSQNGSQSWYQMSTERMYSLHKLGIFWTNYHAATVLSCTWELFIWPFRLALGPEDEYKSIRAILSHFTVDDAIILTTVVIDIVFAMDIFLKLLGHAALDQIEIVEEKKEAKRLRQSQQHIVHNQPSKGDNISDLTLSLGHRSKNFLFYHMPLLLFGCLAAYFPLLFHVPYWVDFVLRVPRLYRIVLLIQFIRKKELDVYFNVRTVAFLKFCLILFGVSHWIGCIFYWIPRVQGFPSGDMNDSWLYQFEQRSGVSFETGHTDLYKSYLIIFYRGLNAITNLAYEPMVPRRLEEIIVCTLTIFLQVYVEAYILGTLFHYLVKKNTALEEFVELVSNLNEYCTARNLPKNLQSRLISYFEFQKAKYIQDDSKILHALPVSLKMKFTHNKYYQLFEHSYLFRGCNAQFLDQITVKLRQIFLMPSEVILKQREMPRELYFVKQGIMEASKDGVVIRRIRHDSEGSTTLGEVAFFMGISQPEALSATRTGDVTLLLFSKLDYEDLMAFYPEQQDIIITNLLSKFDLDKNGNDMVHAQIDQEDTHFIELRQAIQGAIQKRNADALSTITYAASTGDVETVKNLLARGVPVNQGDYDSRTTLHLASCEGNTRVIEVLLSEGANPNIEDRWSGTPLSDAILNKQTQSVELLKSAGAKLILESPATMLCGAASQDDIVMMESFLENGIDANCGDYDNRTALHLAASGAKLRVAEFLVRKGADVNAVDRWGNTPIVDAISTCSDIVVKLLRTYGATLPRGYGTEQLLKASGYGDIFMIEILLSAGVNVNSVDFDQRTALHEAAKEGELMSVYYLLCKNAKINSKDRWGCTPLHNSLKGGHLTCAQLLLSFGSNINESHHSKMLDDMKSGAAPSVSDVWEQISKVNDMISSSRVPKGYLITNDEEHLKDFNHRVLVQMVHVLHDVKKETEKVLELLILMTDSISPLYSFLQMLFVKKSTADGIEVPTDAKRIGKGDNQPGGENKVDVRALAEPRVQRRPKDVPELHIPGVSPVKQPAGPVVGIFDNFDAMVAAEALAAKESNKALPAADEGASSLDKKGKAIHKIMLKFGCVEATLEWLEDVLLQASEYPAKTAFEAIIRRLDIECDDKMKLQIAKDIKKSAEDGIQESIGDVSIPGLIASEDFQTLVQEKKKTLCKVETWNSAATIAESKSLANGEAIALHWVVQLEQAMSVIRELFSFFDDANNGYIDLENIEIMQKHVGFVMVEVLVHGAQRCDGGSSQHLTYRQFVGCVAFWLGLEKEDNTCSSTETNNTWSQSGCYTDFSIDEEVKDPVSQAEDEELIKRIDDAFVKVLARRESMQGSPLKKNNRKMWSVMALLKQIFTFLRNFFEKQQLRSGSKVAPSDLMGIFVAADKNESGRIEKDELALMIVEMQDGQGLPPTKDQVNEIFKRFDCDGDDWISFEEFKATILDHLKKHSTLSSLFSPQETYIEVSKWVVDVHNSWLKWWDKMAVHYLAIFYAIEVPINICFRAATRHGLWYRMMQYIGDALLWGDITLNFFRSYINKNSVAVVDKQTIRENYLVTYFGLDIATAFPLDVLVWTSGGSEAYMSWLRIFRMLRVYKSMILHKQTAKADRQMKGGIKNIAPMLLAFSHLLGCAWWYIGTYSILEDSQDNDLKDHWIGHYPAFGTGNTLDASVIQQYCLSFYWATASLSTNGQIGAAHPKTYIEMLYACGIMLLSMTVYIYVLGELSDHVMNQDEKLVATRRQVQTVQTFIKVNEVPEELQQEIIRHFDTVHAESNGDGTKNRIDIFSMLSHSLQVEVARRISHTLVESCYVFENCDGNFIDAICVLLREVTVPPENYLFRKNEVSKDLYIIARGSVELTEDDEIEGEIVHETLERGGMVGELGFFFGMRQTMHARTTLGSPSTMFGLDKSEYQQLAKLYQEAEEQVSRNILDYWGGTMTSRSSNLSNGWQSAKPSAKASERMSAMISTRGTARPGQLSQRGGGDSDKEDNGMGAIRQMLSVARQKKHAEKIGQVLEAASL